MERSLVATLSLDEQKERNQVMHSPTCRIAISSYYSLNNQVRKVKLLKQVVLQDQIIICFLFTILLPNITPVTSLIRLTYFG